MKTIIFFALVLIPVLSQAADKPAANPAKPAIQALLSVAKETAQATGTFIGGVVIADGKIVVPFQSAKAKLIFIDLATGEVAVQTVDLGGVSPGPNPDPKPDPTPTGYREKLASLLAKITDANKASVASETAKIFAALANAMTEGTLGLTTIKKVMPDQVATIGEKAPSWKEPLELVNAEFQKTTTVESAAIVLNVAAEELRKVK